jgi:hypothetical protein
MNKLTKDAVAAATKLERIWDQLAARRERKLQEVDEIQAQMRRLYPMLPPARTDGPDAA